MLVITTIQPADPKRESMTDYGLRQAIWHLEDGNLELAMSVLRETVRARKEEQRDTLPNHFSRL